MDDIKKAIEEASNRYYTEVFNFFTEEEKIIAKAGFTNGAFFILHYSRWRKVSEELPECNEDVLVKINIQGYIHFAIDRVIYGEWMNGDDGIIEWKYIG